MSNQEFKVYKGLQKPLVFRYFKGQYIYWGAGSTLGGLILTMIISSLTNLWYGAIVFASVVGGGLAITAMMQRKGLHSKKKLNGIFIIPNHYRKSVNLEKKEI